jgi:hypothetical protein
LRLTGEIIEQFRGKIAQEVAASSGKKGGLTSDIVGAVENDGVGPGI